MRSTTLSDNQRKRVPAMVLTFLFLFSLSQMFVLQPVEAQGPTNGWSLPFNISKSGSSSDPEIVVDADGTSHVIWIDEIAGYRYSNSNSGVEWSQPTTVDFPFSTYRPTLLRANNNTIYAFWQDSDLVLSTSRVFGYDFGNGWLWGKQVSLAQSVLAYDVAVDSEGVIHLAFINLQDSAELPSGIYYRRSLLGREDWTEPQLIYPSLYLRGITSEQANISIAIEETNEEEVIYVAWDEQPLLKVFYSMSVNKGTDWDTPVTVDSMNENSGLDIPYGIVVVAWNEQILLLWKRGSAGRSCNILYQESANQGQTWTKGSLPTSLSQCPVEDSFLQNDSNVLYWEATINNQIYLTAWNGSQWSEPQPQTDLSSTTEANINRPLSLGCWNLVLPPEQNSILAIGCDVDGNRDIWFASIKLGNPQSWFPPESAWDRPVKILEVQGESRSMNLLADDQGNLHRLWLQPAKTARGNIPSSDESISDSIYYSYWDGKLWTQPVSILQAPQRTVGRLSAVVAPEGKLMAVWQDNQMGEIYFSWANITRAYIPAEWTSPVLLSEPASLSHSPIITVSRGGIYVVYTIPINEKRGVYLTRSNDSGKTWTPPVTVFDAQAAGWEMVEDPSLAVTYDGQIHVSWMRETLLGTRFFLGFYYTRSNDGGDSWSDLVTLKEGPVLWGKVIASDDGRLHQVWQEGTDRNVIRTRISNDQGNTWESSEILAATGETDGTTNLFSGPTGTLYLLRLFTDESSNLTLQHWENQTGSWITGELWDTIQENNPNVKSVRALASVITRQGVHAFVYAVSQEGETGANPSDNYYFTSRSVELSDVLPNVPPLLPEQNDVKSTLPESTPSASPIATPSPMLPTEPVDDLNSAPGSEENAWTGLILSIALSGIIVIIGFVVMFSRKRFQ